MNSHFQSSEATWTRNGFTVDAIGLRGLKSCEPTHATPPTRNTVIAGIDQTSISRRPEYAKFGRYRARSFDSRNQKATPSVARITGITIASMMPSELKRICRSAVAIGPFGSSTPSLQPLSIAAPIKATASGVYRMLHLVRPGGGGVARGAYRTEEEFGVRRSAANPCTTRREHECAMVRQQCGEQHEQVGDGEREQPMRSSSISLRTPPQLKREPNENRSADKGDRPIDDAGKAEHPRQHRNRQKGHAVNEDLSRRCS